MEMAMIFGGVVWLGMVARMMRRDCASRLGGDMREPFARQVSLGACSPRAISIEIQTNIKWRLPTVNKSTSTLSAPFAASAHAGKTYTRTSASPLPSYAWPEATYPLTFASASKHAEWRRRKVLVLPLARMRTAKWYPMLREPPIERNMVSPKLFVDIAR